MKHFLFFLLLISSITCNASEVQTDEVESLRAPQFERQLRRSGEFSIVLEQEIPRQCIAVLVSPEYNTRLVISRRLLENIVAKGNKASQQNTHLRSNDLLGKRASGLLQNLRNQIDKYGCVRSEAPRDSYYLLADLLNAGQLVVIDDDTGEFERSLKVNFMEGGAGAIAFYFLSRGKFSRSLFSLQLWVR